MIKSPRNFRVVCQILQTLEQGQPVSGGSDEHAGILGLGLATGEGTKEQGFELRELTPRGKELLEILSDADVMLRLEMLASTCGVKLTLGNLARLHRAFRALEAQKPELVHEVCSFGGFSVLNSVRLAAALHEQLTQDINAEQAL